MKEQNKKFESAWEETFENAEMIPDAHVWDKIELGLTRNENSGFKRRILFFKLMAAASVLFAAVVGGYTVLNTTAPGDTKTDKTIVLNNAKHEEKTLNENDKNDGAEEGGMDGLPDQKSTPTVGQKSEIEKGSSADEFDEKMTDIFDEESKSTDKNSSLKTERNDVEKTKEMIPVFLTQKAPERSAEEELKATVESAQNKVEFMTKSGPEKVEKLGAILDESGALLEGEMAYVPRLEYLYNDTKSYDKMRVGIGLAYGQNNPSASGDQQAAAATLGAASGAGFQSQSAVVSEEQMGSVLTAGVAVGKQVSKRWILESGLNFIKRSTLVESNLAIEKSGRLEALNNDGLTSGGEQLIVTNRYEIENNYNSISVPVQAGYLLVDKKFDVILKAGVANEILLWNRVEDTSGTLDGATLKPGESSQYNTYILSGIFGWELSYLLSDQYYIALTPQLMKSINSITKSDLNAESRPLSFTLGLRVSYSF